ncbi:MAG: polysaccharide deacetylase family protein [Ferrovibrio sp.]|uniref:polysaccharide deacetylase family protein n=1 Tax=Ferrovibrio sp. TaxID=1917215 RepID=UPI00391B5C93
MTVGPAAWAALTAELDLWAAEGRQAVFWWRDDDAVKVTPSLERLANLQSTSAIPLALAVIPAQAEDDLAGFLATRPNIAALQHGYAHRNHAAAGAKKSEFPAGRPLALQLEDVRLGQSLLAPKFGGALLPVFVPPWNRAAPDILPGLADLGFRAISGFTPRPGYWAGPGLAWLNTQIDPIDWHGQQNHIAAAAGLQAAAELLHAMRAGGQPLQPIGFLTHHLRHDAFLWDFTAEFLATVAQHPGSRWVGTNEALAVGRPPTPVMQAS